MWRSVWKVEEWNWTIEVEGGSFSSDLLFISGITFDDV